MACGSAAIMGDQSPSEDWQRQTRVYHAVQKEMAAASAAAIG